MIWRMNRLQTFVDMVIVCDRMATSRLSFVHSCFLEALEARIAPAIVINVGAPFDGEGQPIDPGSFNYNFAPEGQPNPFRLVSPGGVDSGPVYELSLGTSKSSNDVRQLNVYSGAQSFQPWITIKGSTATAFFTDSNRNGVVDDNELTGMAFGNRLNLAINSSVYGDIIGNGGGRGSTSLVAPDGPSINFLRVAGSIEGSVVASGAISKVDITGTVERISTASLGDIRFNFGLGEQTLAAYTPAAGVAGGSLSAITVGEADVIQAGNGGSGAAGGSISKVTVIDDPNGLSILAGSGGSGARGGAGGSITQVVVAGAGASLDTLPPEAVIVHAGDGGASSGLGGKGGNLSNISIGYSTVSGKLENSPEPSATPVVLAAGDGGDGSRGGAGGLVRDLKVLVNTPDRPALDEIVITAGQGGAGTARDGVGGGVTGVTAENIAFNLVDPAADRDSIVVRAGAAGDGAGEGARGGSVSKVNLMADRVEVYAGDGSQGTAAGGAGGSLANVSLLFNESEQVRSLVLQAGAGGNSSATGRGGAGGGVKSISGLFVDLLNDDVFKQPSRVAAGDGGAGGRGGAGGALTDVEIFEPGNTRDLAQVAFLGGAGGEGQQLGGQGGGVVGLTFIGFATTPTLQAGDGGAAANGKGGNGGALRNAVLRSDWVLGDISNGERLTPQVAASAGAGGNGQGATGRGGVGGSVANLNVRMSGPLGTVQAAAPGEAPGTQIFVNATPDSPALIEWQQFDPSNLVVNGVDGSYSTKAALVDVALRVNSSLRGEVADPLDPALFASFIVRNNSLPGLPPLSVTGATAQAEVQFVGRNAPEPLTAALPTVLRLTPSAANVVSGQALTFEISNPSPTGGLPIQPLRPIISDLLSSEIDTDPFFTGRGVVGMNLLPDLQVALFVPNAVDPADVEIDTTGLFMAGTVELTYGFMEWVDLSVAAGGGGDGTLAVGAGGSISRTAAVTLAGNTIMAAGDAGDPTGSASRRANGGSIATAMLMASENVTVTAGDGAAGGNGGSIRTVGWLKGALDAAGNLDGLLAPTGNIIVQAGQGSSLGSAGGAGGSINGASGLSSSDPEALVLVAAGDGSGQGGGTAGRGTNGGSVSNVNFFGGLAAPQVIAGHAGDATASAGGKGGSVTAISAQPGLDILQVAAGDGGNGVARGGVGGSVSQLNIFGDIGIRSGEAFGFATAAGGAGGIFAGAGGSGAVDGQAGRVTDVTAAAISSIVAGRPTTANPQNLELVSLVDRISLRGLSAPTLEPQPPLPGSSAPRYDGAFSSVTAPAQTPSVLYPIGRPGTTAFGEANLVGSIAGSPFAVGANVYKTTDGPVASTVTAWSLGTTRPLDGLVAAISFGQNINFRPEALLTVSDPRNPVNFVLVDYRNNFNANF